MKVINESEDIPRFTVLYRDNEAVAAVVKHEKLLGTFFYVTGIIMEKCYKSNERDYCRALEFETYGSRAGTAGNVLNAYNEALSAAEREIGATPNKKGEK